MDVISILSLMFGVSPAYGLKRQLISSSWFTNNDALYGYEEDQGNKKEQEAPIKDNESRDEPSVVNLKMQRESTRPPIQRGKVLRNFDAWTRKDSSQIAYSRPKRNLAGIVKSSTQKDSTSIAHSKARRNLAGAGTVKTTPKTNGCRFESDKTIPETLTKSISFMVEVSSEIWNCLLGNTINTIVALGHLPLLTVRPFIIMIIG
jgi:hypothetical protein